jgi:hypothetical protein
MEQQIQIQGDPNLYYLNSASLIFSEEESVITLISGNTGKRYVMSPMHMKRLSLLLNKEVDAYEKKFGKLDTELPKNEHTGEKITPGFKAE